MAKRSKATKVAPKKKVTRAKKKVARAKPKDTGAAFNRAMSEKGFVELLRFSDDDCLAHLKGCLSTGCITLDGLLGGRGIPLGRITEIYGQWHIGKTTLLNQLFASAQQQGGWAGVFDTETAMSESYTVGLGVDPDRLSYAQFERGKGTLENVCQVILQSVRWWRENDPDRIVVLGLDSLGGTPTADEMRSALTSVEVSDDGKKTKKAGRQPGATARVMHAFRRLIPQELGNTNIALVIINHEYTSWAAGKSRRETFGGEAMRAAASVRIRLFSVGNWLTRSDGVTIGREINADLVKDKIFGRTSGRARFALLNGVGVDNTWALQEDLIRLGAVVKGGGGWCAMNLDGETLKWQGWPGFQALCVKPVPEGQLGYFDRMVAVYRQLTKEMG